MSSSDILTTELATYLFTRLRQLGIHSIFGVPGDYNLRLLDYVAPSGLQWIGNANELNAAYAADGYARIKGIAAIVTTFGVGELSAVNAIAGSYAEFAPVIHIVGTPSREKQSSRARVHHTFNDGDYQRFSQIYERVTAAQTSLWDVSTLTDQIDWTIRQCLLHQRPVYIQVPDDLVQTRVPADGLANPISMSSPGFVEDDRLTSFCSDVVEKLYLADCPLILVDGETRPLGISSDVQSFIDVTGWSTWTTPFGKGLVDETRSTFHGVYRGKFDSAAVQNIFEKADLIVNLGPHHSSSNTYGFSAVPRSEVTISFTMTGVQVFNNTVPDLPSRLVLRKLLERIDASRLKANTITSQLPRDFTLSFSDQDPSSPITQDKLWRLIAPILRPGDIVLGETGTAGYGVREMPLPPSARVFTPVTWLSIGYMLPAALGAAKAQEEMRASSSHQDARTILLIGDGSFQMTAQELSTIIRQKLDVIVFLINNNGYTIERAIHGRRQGYNDIAGWRYLEAPSFFGAKEDSFTARASTWGELNEILQDANFVDGKGLRMVEVTVGEEDVPAGPLSHYLETQKRLEK